MKKIALTLPLVLLLAACMGNGQNTVTSVDGAEATLDQDLDGDGLVDTATGER
ncbi:hypothetical protein [Nereida sp. MMG025]|uniref:hypothetical protein n=1 Tax=Nereida sp. MMG025 TaxID=2909981 RepID=UPI001F3E3BB0|nr:hypothetical protein [Nereida sp. MMG025]MCF6445511.1 hypothetical protein [Nereida sp. MMG025]